MWFYREKKNTDKALTRSLNFLESNFIQNFGFPLPKKIFFEVLAAQQKDLATIPRRCPRISVAYGSICLRRLGDLYLRQQEGFLSQHVVVGGSCMTEFNPSDTNREMIPCVV